MKRISVSKAFFKASFAITLLALLTLTFTVFRSRSMWPELLANSKTVSKPIGTDRIAKVGNSTVFGPGCMYASDGGSGYSDPKEYGALLAKNPFIFVQVQIGLDVTIAAAFPPAVGGVSVSNQPAILKRVYT